MYRQARWREPLVYEYPGRSAPPPSPPLEESVAREVGGLGVPEGLLRGDPPPIPQLSEAELVRHYTRLSQMSYGVDSGPVPLGSCTMKYNPRVIARYAFDERIMLLHPAQPVEEVQGLLEAAYRLQEWLAAITGMDECSLHPAAGAQGELAGVLMIRRYHELLGRPRSEVIVPDSAHGTNPASAAMAGFRVVEVPTGPDGNVDLEALRAAVSPETAGLMITNPSTLGLFEENILEIARVIHEAGGLLYYDGANLNGILGYARPGDMGFDIAHVNLHKTFSAPHGGGGPGAGPVCARRIPIGDTGLYLTDLLPGPRVVYDEDTGLYRLEAPRASIGRLRTWWFQTTVVLWAHAYILALGAEGLRRAGEASVANANLLLRLLEGEPGYEAPYAPGRPRKHEVVVSAAPLRRETGATAEDVAKYMLDQGLYAPTIYFPLIVEEALMIEPTESETPETIQALAAAMKEAAREAREDPERLHSRPLNTAARRVDMVRANHPRTVTPSWRIHLERQRNPGLTLR